ncbi:uncharacterized protein UV8b_08265 [Ustilaginoidea virens]|uniref:Major facilitator superfamily (MFS) profile domain-containing protein n=1 Tax=Ustilaginoidea virens TaxID=1159556 RepID=A0A8E5HYM7_USTVR|nr:uncharacterized protein UV8b_08265 [Ustilaginoidea virens]QUC24024.1 hypothetical protein UV8b_08265 [Ustilaginoidea virens]
MATYLYNCIWGSNEAPTKEAPEPCRHQPSTHLPCQSCKADEAMATKYRWKIVLGLVAPFTLQALDATIIASALPWIARDFSQLSQQNWIVSSFTITSAAFIPFWAQIADVFGRYLSIIAAVLTMMLGSALCAAAPTSAYPMLLLGRAFQGIAASGLNVVVRTILADRVTLKESARNWALFAIIGGVSYGIGPVVGGYLSSADWRWCFGIDLPVGALGLAAIFFVLRKELLGPQPITELNETAETGVRRKLVARLKTIDVGGQILFMLGFGLLVLALTWGGVTYAWDSAAVISSLVLGCLFVVLFFVWESMLTPGRMLNRLWPSQRAMIPWGMLTNRDVGLIFYTEVATGMALFSVLFFGNIYFIAVQGYSADKAGLQLLYFVPGMGVGVYLCSFACNTYPRMTFPTLFFGTLTEAVGLSILVWAMYIQHLPTVFGMMIMVGIGVGLRFMVAPLHGIAIFKNHRAALIGLMAIATPLGGTVCLTIMSTVFNNTSGLDYKHGDFSESQNGTGPAAEKAIQDAKMGVVWAFVAIVPFMALSFLSCFLIGNVKLGDRSAVDDDEGNLNVIFTKPYFWTWLRGEGAEAEQEAIRLQSGNESAKTSRASVVQSLAA